MMKRDPLAFVWFENLSIVVTTFPAPYERKVTVIL